MPALATTPTVADAIEQTLEWLDRQGCADRIDNRRKVQRSRYRMTARITTRVPGQLGRSQIDVTTRNLSRSGLSFVHRTLLYPGQPVDVHLPLPDKSVRHIRSRVAHVRLAQGGMFEIGVRFVDLEIAVANDIEQSAL